MFLCIITVTHQLALPGVARTISGLEREIMEFFKISCHSPFLGSFVNISACRAYNFYLPVVQTGNLRSLIFGE